MEALVYKSLLGRWLGLVIFCADITSREAEGQGLGNEGSAVGAGQAGECELCVAWRGWALPCGHAQRGRTGVRPLESVPWVAPECPVATYAATTQAGVSQLVR